MVHAPEDVRRQHNPSIVSTIHRSASDCDWVRGLEWDRNTHAFGVDPLRIEIRQCGLVAQLLYGFLGLLIYLENTTGPPSPSGLLVTHIPVGTTSRRVGTDVVGDGAGEEDWGRHFGGIGGRRLGRGF
jgi:hypothetical protein